MAGEPGIGKTRLIDAFVQALGDAAPRLARGQCIDQRGAGEPYMPVLDALEISKRTGLEKGRLQYPELKHYTFLTSSDAHFIKDIGSSITRIMMASPNFDELKMALERQNGRLILE